jgi:hypothetical protein
MYCGQGPEWKIYTDYTHTLARSSKNIVLAKYIALHVLAKYVKYIVLA